MRHLTSTIKNNWKTRVSVIWETLACLLMPNAHINISLWTYSVQEPEILKLSLFVKFIHYVDRNRQLTRVDATCMHQMKPFIASECSLEIWLCSYYDWLNKARTNHLFISLRTITRILWDFLWRFVVIKLPIRFALTSKIWYFGPLNYRLVNQKKSIFFLFKRQFFYILSSSKDRYGLLKWTIQPSKNGFKFII